jgi:assimilatory nitrate reductase catalytic subunit
MSPTAVRTTCPYCGVGCGVIAEPTGGTVQVRGDYDHPANRGALCSKGSALGETVGLQGRLLQPRVNGVDTGWDPALDTVAQGFRRVIERHGPDAVALYVSGQMLTEDYYVANKFMKGFVGSANIDTNSRLCMSSAVAAHKRAFGEDLVPLSYDDLDLADLIVLVGSNLAWCHPVLYQRILKARAQRPEMRVVVLDPRRTATCDESDLHIPLRAGSDVMVFNGLLSFLAQHGHTHEQFVREHTHGAARTMLVAHNTAGDVSSVARACGVQEESVRRFYALFAATERVITLFSQGVNQSSSGTDKASSIINAHLLTGRIGRPGMGPFSITGQPNAMGGREVGGMANMLAAHLELDNAEHRRLVQDFWRSPRMAERPGLKAVELFESLHAGRVKAVWIMATNPVVSLPNADRARAALRNCELVVVSDCIAQTDTTAHAHVLLPAAAWGEKQGTVTNSDRHISRQRAFLPLPGNAQPDWWMICQVARRMGFETGFNYAGAHEIFAEHARLSSVAQAAGRAFDLSGIANLSESAYADLRPVQWPVSTPNGGAERLFADGQFYHSDGRARLVATVPRRPIFALDQEYPLVLNTGRIRDQWHSMTRTGRSARLGAHLPEPFVDMHAADALSFGVRDGCLVRVITRWGRMVGRLRTSGEMARGAIFAPIHWSDCNASDARIGSLTSPAVDPVSGEPEFKFTPARVEPFVATWYGFVLSRREITAQPLSWWSRTTIEEGCRYEVAGRSVPANWPRWARRLLLDDRDSDWIDYEDGSVGKYRAASIRDDRLEACVCIGPQPELPSRTALLPLFKKARLDASDRAALLGGRALSSGGRDATVCACLGVSRGAIENAIAQGCRDAGAIGRKLKAGTNCGSCVPEIRRLLELRVVPAQLQLGC